MDIKTKANIDDIIYFMSENKVTTSVVRYIKIEVKDTQTEFGPRQMTDITYHTSHGHKIQEEETFLTKQALLESL